VKRETTLRIKGARHTLGARTWIMGVVNVTPDSFFDGGAHADTESAVAHGLRLAEEGADILDIGGESSRPGSDPVPADEELRRVLPVLCGLRARTAALLSVDTTKPEVAEAVLAAGADIINAISAARGDTRIFELVAAAGAGLVLVHMQGTPKTMQADPHYDDVVAEVRAFLAERMDTARTCGVTAESIILDPGIGFGKRVEDNLALLNAVDDLASLGRPVLLGVSRKNFIGRILSVPPQDRLEGTIGASIVGLVRGAHILRVHDVESVGRAARVADAILAAGTTTGAGPRIRNGNPAHVQ
jgi:dihydropteroate synthase